jgi:hypothetical protein
VRGRVGQQAGELGAGDGRVVVVFVVGLLRMLLLLLLLLRRRRRRKRASTPAPSRGRCASRELDGFADALHSWIEKEGEREDEGRTC